MINFHQMIDFSFSRIWNFFFRRLNRWNLCQTAAKCRPLIHYCVHIEHIENFPCKIRFGFLLWWRNFRQLSIEQFWQFWVANDLIKLPAAIHISAAIILKSRTLKSVKFVLDSIPLLSCTTRVFRSAVGVLSIAVSMMNFFGCHYLSVDSRDYF